MGMKKLIRSLVLGVVMVAVSCRPAKQELNVFFWSEYLDPQLVAQFEKEFDCRVHVDLFDNPEVMLAKLAAGGDSQYDVIVPSNNTLPALVQRKLVAPLDHGKIPNLRHLDPRFTQQAFDVGNQFSVPYQWGTVGIFVRVPPGKVLEETWGLLFDPSKQLGPFYLMDDQRSCIASALKYKGYSLNSMNATQLAEVRDLLIQTKNRSLGFAVGIAGKTRVLTRDAVLCVHYNNDSNRGVKEDPETRFFVPREGGELWVDVLSITARAPHRELAEKFINFTLEPKISAQTSKYTLSATPNASAMAFLDERDRKNPSIYPPPDAFDRLELGRDLGGFTKLYDDLWTEIKSK